MEKKILCSYDTGIDSALTIAYLLAQKECEVVGITVSYGMGRVGNVYRNTKAALKPLDREDILVAMESGTPSSGIPNDYSGGSRFYGCEGLGETLGPSSPGDYAGVKPEKAIDSILQMIRIYRKELYWIASGPLTGIAKVLDKGRKTAEKAGAVHIMEGAIASPGNTGPYMEVLMGANVRLDIPATAQVLDFRPSVVLVGLDVTGRASSSFEDHERRYQIGARSVLFLYEASKRYLGAREKPHPYLEGCRLYGLLTTMAVIHLEILTIIPMHMMCLTQGSQAGKTTENVLQCNDRGYEVKVAASVDAGVFSKEFFGKVEGPLREC